jgi:hypothetical protein
VRLGNPESCTVDLLLNQWTTGTFISAPYTPDCQLPESGNVLMTFRLARAVVAATMCLGGLTAWATVAAGPVLAAACPNGSTCAADSLTLSPAATLVASTHGTMTAANSFTVTYKESVFADPTNEYCSGCLDWVLQMTNSANSVDPIERLNISHFGGFIVDIGVNTNGASGFPSPGTVHPTTVARDGTGKIVTWNFTGPELLPGQTTVRLEAETNATNYETGLASFQDGGSTEFTNAYEPAAPKVGIPEAPWVPGFGVLAGTVAAVFAIARRGRRNLTGIDA